MIKPILTEKSLALAKKGGYSFWVDKGSRKETLKSEISDLFDVKVGSVKTLNIAGEKGKNVRGRKYNKKSVRKVIVTLREGKIDIFDEKA